MLSRYDAFMCAAVWADALGEGGRILPLIPCRGKVPIEKGHSPLMDGREVQSFAQLCGIAERAARGGVGGADAWATSPGIGGLVVVDVDDLRQYRRIVGLYGESPVCVLSPGRGLHLWYRAPVPPSGAATPTVVRTTAKGLSGYDVKAWRSLCHLPGSKHPAPLDPRRPYYAPMGSAFVCDGKGVALEDFVARFDGQDLRRLLPEFRVDAYEAELDAIGRPLRPTATRGVDDFVLEPDADNLARWRAYLAAAGPAVAGQGGHLHTRGLALKLGDLGCDEATCLDLLADWNRTCAPPWSDRELEAKVADAYRTRLEALGWRVGDDEEGYSAA